MSEKNYMMVVFAGIFIAFAMLFLNGCARSSGRFLLKAGERLVIQPDRQPSEFNQFWWDFDNEMDDLKEQIK